MMNAIGRRATRSAYLQGAERGSSEPWAEWRTCTTCERPFQVVRPSQSHCRPSCVRAETSRSGRLRPPGLFPDDVCV